MKQNLVVMLIDDTSSEHRLFKEVLKTVEPTIKLISMRDGKSAIAYFSKKDSPLPDYVFLDLNMPGMDGLECLKLIKKIKAADHIPIIMYSTSSLDSYEEAAKLLGAVQCINKEVDFDVSCRQVTSVLESVQHLHHDD